MIRYLAQLNHGAVGLPGAGELALPDPSAIPDISQYLTLRSD
jgi:hypothetical protein